MIDEEFLKAKLIEENEEFRQVHEEHRACQAELDKLERAASLSEGDILLEKELKKRKLTLKDRMYRMMSEYAGKAGLVG